MSEANKARLRELGYTPKPPGGHSLPPGRTVNTPAIREAVRLLEQALGAIGGCGDTSCEIIAPRPDTMATNGGCRCEHWKTVRALRAYRQFQRRVNAAMA